MLGHLTHPSVGTALCLEHGCEKTHNDFFNGALSQLGLDPSSYGYASIQVRAVRRGKDRRNGGTDARLMCCLPFC